MVELSTELESKSAELDRLEMEFRGGVRKVGFMGQVRILNPL